MQHQPTAKGYSIYNNSNANSNSNGSTYSLFADQDNNDNDTKRKIAKVYYDDSTSSNDSWRVSSEWRLLFLIVWVALGIAAFVQSIVCTESRVEGSDATKVVMFMLACLFGPFWWLFYLVMRKSGGYCRPRTLTPETTSSS
jgi:hypothetical protein